jgi:hypothetical protein
MAEIDEIGVVDGLPTSGTGEVPTLAPIRDALQDLLVSVESSIPAGTNLIGKMQPGFGAAQLTSAPLTFASSGDNTAVTRATGTIKVYGIFLTLATPTTLTIKNGAGSSLTGAMTLSSLFLPIQSEPYFTTTSTNNLVINLGSAVQCSGTVYYLDT